VDLRSGLADQSVSFSAWTTSTGAAVTVTSATAGLSLWYRRGVAGAKVAITPIGDLATLETAHTDKAILVIEGAEHRLDLPDAATAAGVLTVEWGGTATGITIVGGVANLVGQANTATDVSHVAATAQTPGDVVALIGNIANVGSPSYAAPSAITLTTYGVQTNTYASVDTRNSVYHSFTDSGGFFRTLHGISPIAQSTRSLSASVWRRRLVFW